MIFSLGITLLLLSSAVYCGKLKSSCPAPVAPEHGEVILFEEGRVAEYVCDSGYVLNGKKIVPCVDGKWEESQPSCVENKDATKPVEKVQDIVLENETNDQLNKTTTAKLEDDEGYQSDEGVVYAHYYHNGVPAVMTLTDSQLRWIDSLHPDLRDQYLRGMYLLRVGSPAEPERVASIIARDPYNYIYHVPFVRRAASLVVEDERSTYDYSCSPTYYPFIKAPKLPNMRIARYDTRQNPSNHNKYYLAAMYQCNPGYVMRDTRYDELYCRNQAWVGVRPICDRRI